MKAVTPFPMLLEAPPGPSSSAIVPLGPTEEERPLYIDRTDPPESDPCVAGPSCAAPSP